MNHFQPLYTTFLQKSLILGLFQGFLDYQMANSVHQGLFVNIYKSDVYETGILRWGDCPWDLRFQAQNTRFWAAIGLQSEGWAAPGCASLPCSLRSHRARSLSPARRGIHGRAVCIGTDQLLSFNQFDYWGVTEFRYQRCWSGDQLQRGWPNTSI